ncbi:MAG TPA: DUF3014 domain-containing protein [Dokdonella sp.]
MKQKQTPVGTWLAGGIAIVVAVGAGIYFARNGGEAVSALPGTGMAPSTTAASAPTAAAPIEHPIEQAQVDPGNEPATPLPAIEESDRPVFDAIAALAGGGEALGMLVDPQHLVQRIVATVDGLTRPRLGENVSPLRSAQGVFATRADGAQRVIAGDNAARYEAYAQIARAIDAKKLVAWYVATYPLFQQAYRELGYPDGYFNDRLIAVIDHLLATPDASQPLVVVQPNVLYEFADPALEARSSGQKLLLRSGPQNEAAIKAKLREVRALLVGRNLPES